MSIEEFEKLAFDTSMRMNDIITRDVMSIEWHWRQSGHEVWFLETEKLIEILNKSNFNVDISLIPNMDHPVVVSLPGKDGEKNGGFMMYKSTVGLRRKRLEKFYRSMGFNFNMTFYSDEEDINDDTEIIEVSAHDKSGQTRFRFIVPDTKMDCALKGTFWDDPDTFKQSLLPMESIDCDYERQLFQLASRLLVYIKVFPEVMTSGYPRPKSIHGGYFDKKKSKSRLIGIPEKMKNSPESHYRTWHFRTLRDKRYAAGGELPRMVFVSDTIVGKITPKTVRESKSLTLQ